MKLINCNQENEIIYCVKKDDNLNTILTRYSTTLKNIVRNNPSIDLYEGEVIKIVNKSTLQHIVKPMENLSVIAEKYGIEINKLMEQNNLTTKRLFVGQILNIDNLNK